MICTQEIRNELKLLTLNSRRRFLRFISIFIILHNLDCPDQSRDTIKFRCNMHEKDMRDYKTLLDLPKVKSTSMLVRRTGSLKLLSKFSEIISIINIVLNVLF